MEIEIRVVINYIYVKDLSRKYAYEDLVTKLGENAPSITMVKNGSPNSSEEERAPTMQADLAIQVMSLFLRQWTEF